MEPNEVARVVVDSAIRAHTILGPGLLESVYEACLAHELARRGLKVDRQVLLPIRYGDTVIEAGLRLDIVVEECVILELETAEALLPIHTAQLLTYLKLGGYSLGLLLNFNVVRMKDGIKRLANGMKE